MEKPGRDPIPPSALVAEQEAEIQQPVEHYYLYLKECLTGSAEQPGWPERWQKLDFDRTYQVRRQASADDRILAPTRNVPEIVLPGAGDCDREMSRTRWVELFLPRNGAGWIRFVGDPQRNLAYFRGHPMQPQREYPLVINDWFGTTHSQLILRTFKDKNRQEWQAPIEWRTCYIQLVDRLCAAFDAARSGLSILLLGPTGCGKEVIARWLHHVWLGGRYEVVDATLPVGGSNIAHTCLAPVGSPPRRGPFVPFNCGAIPSTLIESELFGVLPRTYTEVGAREGLLRQAREGTFFIDELHLLPLEAQSRFLRFLSEREIRTVGSDTPQTLSEKDMPLVVAAAKGQLFDLVREGRFLPDLFFRLAGDILELPSLAEREQDLELLVSMLLAQMPRQVYGQLRRKPAPLSASADALDALRDHPFFGNIRELQTTLRRAAVRAIQAGRNEICPDDLGLEPFVALGLGQRPGGQTTPSAELLRDLDVPRFLEALCRCDMNLGRLTPDVVTAEIEGLEKSAPEEVRRKVPGNVMKHLQRLRMHPQVEQDKCADNPCLACLLKRDPERVRRSLGKRDDGPGDDRWKRRLLQLLDGPVLSKRARKHVGAQTLGGLLADCGLTETGVSDRLSRWLPDPTR